MQAAIRACSPAHLGVALPFFPPATPNTSVRCGGWHPSTRWQPQTCLLGIIHEPLFDNACIRTPATAESLSPLADAAVSRNLKWVCNLPVATSSCSSSALLPDRWWCSMATAADIDRSGMRPKSSGQRPPPSDHPIVWCAPSCLTAVSLIILLSPTLPLHSSLACGSPAAPSPFLSPSPSCPKRCERS